MLKRIGLFLLSGIVVISSFSQSRRKSKSSSKKPLAFADSTSIQRRADSLVMLAKAADTLTNNDADLGIKSMMQTAAVNATTKLSATDGFLKNPLVKIGIPAQDLKLERGLRSLGMGKQVDDAIVSMNHAAEDASKSAAPLFADAIKNTNFLNAKQLLKSSDTAAALYLKENTMASLITTLKPIVEASIAKTSAAKYWNTAFTTYNKFGLNKTSTDLTSYVTEKTAAGLFTQLSLEEQQLRASPEIKASDLFKKL